MTTTASVPASSAPAASTSASASASAPALRIGPAEVWPPVVLAPMAGVTNAPFRRLCRQFGDGLFVSEMIMAKALVEGNERTEKMVRFEADEPFRSVQLYGVNPHDVGEAARRLADEDRVDHIDLNFGCPAVKVTRKGGGAAVPVHRPLLRAIVAAAVAATTDAGIPVTVKFRMGIDDDHLTYLDTGRIAEDEGAAAVALHARSAEQHYSGSADWGAIARLKAHVTSIPVLGNGDIADGADALRMMVETGCDGVVVGRGCLGRPWLFRDLADAFAGRPAVPSPTLSEVIAVLRQHAELLVAWFGPVKGPREMRKHVGWYLKGFPIGSEARRELAMVSSLDELDGRLAALLERVDGSIRLTPAEARIMRGHTNGPRKVVLPEGWLDAVDDATPPEELDVSAGVVLSGG